VKPYFDFTFLPLLVTHTPQARWAEGLASKFSLPWTINYLHLTQLENLFARLQLEGHTAQKRSGASIAALWRARLAEGIFVIENPPWDDVWRITMGLHRELIAPVPQPSHLIHLAAAQLSNSSHYFSLHNSGRELARRVGLSVLPEKL
jgi:hypothetical protein